MRRGKPVICSLPRILPSLDLTDTLAFHKFPYCYMILENSIGINFVFFFFFLNSVPCVKAVQMLVETRLSNLTWFAIYLWVRKTENCLKTTSNIETLFLKNVTDHYFKIRDLQL